MLEGALVQAGSNGKWVGEPDYTGLAPQLNGPMVSERAPALSLLTPLHRAMKSVKQAVGTRRSMDLAVCAVCEVLGVRPIL